MKKIYLMAIAAAFTFGLTSCEEFLDSSNYTEANTANYPASAADLNKELSALYGVMNQYCTDPLQTPGLLVISCLMMLTVLVVLVTLRVML